MRYTPFRFYRFNFKKNAVIAVPVVVVCIAFVIVLSTVIIPNSRYKAAEELYYAERYDEAVAAFTALNGYKDSEDMIERCYIGQISEEKYNLIKSINIGDTYVFGEYEQDNDTSNGKEEIEWIVLDKDGIDLLLISKYALEYQQFNSSRGNVTWDNCSLRQWLNDTFLNAAFTEEEQNEIISTEVIAGVNPAYPFSAGNDTTDKVFLLSITEANKYFDSNNARQCIPTEYCRAQKEDEDNNTTTSRWWLRSPGYCSIGAANVSFGGAVVTRGDGVNRRDFAVRPALWLDLGT